MNSLWDNVYVAVIAAQVGAIQKPQGRDIARIVAYAKQVADAAVPNPPPKK